MGEELKKDFGGGVGGRHGGSLYLSLYSSQSLLGLHTYVMSEKKLPLT